MKSSLLIVMVCWITVGVSQEVEDVFLDEMAIEYAEYAETDPDEEEVQVYATRRNKININQSDAGDLATIPFLTPPQIRNLAAYLDQYGEVFSLFELQAVEGFDSSVILRLASCLEIGPPRDLFRMTPKNLLRQGRHELVVRFRQVVEKQDGYAARDSTSCRETDEAYLGAPQRYYFRYRYACSDKVLIGLSGDKDAGEEFFRGNQPLGMDFYSGFLAIQNFRWMRQLIVGHFRASWGQGLTVGGSSFGSSVSFGSAMQYREGFRPSQSVCEYGYLRGAAVTIRTGPMEWSGFFSCTNHDATMSTVDTLSPASSIFTSFTETGYHRTPSEMARKNQVKEWSYGGHVSYRGPFFLLGVTGYYGTWNRNIQPEEKAYRLFGLTGNRFGAFGADGRFRIGFVQVFGEFSRSLNGGTAWLAGMTAIPAPGFDLLFIYRNYQPQYQNPYSAAIAQQGEAVNEQGLFLRLQTQIIRKTTLSGYLDIFRFPWLLYRVNGPSKGTEAGLMGIYQGSAFWSLSLRYGWRVTEQNQTGLSSNILSLVDARKQNVHMEVNIRALPAVILKSCLMLREYRAPGQPNASGYVASQEIRYQGMGILRSIRLKYSLFDVPHYHARMYASEPDVLYGWSSQAFYGKGFRFVLLCQSGFGRRVDLWAWLGLTCYVDRESIGSGLERMDGNVKTEVRVQARVRL